MNPTRAQLAAAAEAIAYVLDGNLDPEVVARVIAALDPIGYALVHPIRRNIWMEPHTGRQHQPGGGFIRCALIPVGDP